MTLSPLSLADVLRLVRRRWRSILATVAFAVTATLGVALAGPARFGATATILIETKGHSQLVGDLAALTSLGGGLAARSQVEILRSRSIAEQAVAAPEGGFPPTPDVPGFERHVGLQTTVQDEGLTPLAILLARFADSAGADRSPAQPRARLFARLEPIEPGAPERVRIRFLDGRTVRVSVAGLLQRIGLADAHEEELTLVPGEPLSYRGLRIHLAPSGPIEGRSFLIRYLPPYEAVEELLESYWAAETTRNSGVIRVTVQDTDPYRASEIANALCNNYLDETRARNRQRATRTIEFVQSLLDASRGALQQAEERLAEIRAERPAVIDVAASATALIQEASRLEIQGVEMRLHEHSLAELLEALEEGETRALARLDSAVTNGLVVDPITEGYLGRIAELNAEYTEALGQLEPAHPRLGELRDAGRKLVGLVKIQLESRLEGLRARREEIHGESEARTRELARLPEDMRLVADPLMQVQIHSELIPTLLENLQAAEITNASLELTAEYLDRAKPATRMSSPRVGPTLAVATLLGLALGVFLALVRDPVTGRVTTAADLADVAGLPVLGRIPLAGRGPAAGLLPRDAPDSEVAEAIRSLRAGVKNALGTGGEDGPTVLGITSASPGEGRSMVAAGLAQAFALGGTRVALVDADLHGAAQERTFGLERGTGLAECLADGGGAGAHLRPTGVPGLELLSAGRTSAWPADLLAGGGMDAVLDELRSAFDLVLVDLPPALGSSDLEALAPKLDGLLFLCRGGAARRADIQGALVRVRRAGGALIGAILQGGTGPPHA